MFAGQFGVVSFKVEKHGFLDVPPTRFKEAPKMNVSVCQHMGDRRTQEDRYLVCPSLPVDSNSRGNEPPAVFGIFDGTVGDFASDNVKDIVIPTLLELPSWHQFCSKSTFDAALLATAFSDMFRVSDNRLLQRCSTAKQHYSTSTGVMMMVVEGHIVVGHLGDSRLVLGYEENGELIGKQATMDHKPDDESERRRIEECGGLVERLVNHNNKPFIRGGDFMMRKALGEQPMQLQYSHAFGSKDLKIFGMSDVPDVNVHRKTPGCKSAILASDGLWDVVESTQAVRIVHQASQQGHSPATALVQAALMEQSRRKARADNVTAVVIQFD